MRFFAFVMAALAAGAHASPVEIDGRQLSSANTVVPPHLVCKQDSDCVVRNVGNCCGYYPRCANANAVLPKPCPGGGVGICGFPNIDSCKCGSNGGCVSLQGGSAV
ncbi:hypothetical protein B0T11DRAFT_290674 [Plectosphaerella cucumerina]|uniref:Uncharacterized protein n=1 Tax=Plectosphaerella cucumerina TaxID=40658 RepID=A0A8K0TB55_9PEZI|nr:hypothetical protein B0T11DRAFT_290674 [Plectosphaerella cucumerina]